MNEKMNKTGLIKHCKKALANKVKYVYGAKMEVLSYQQIKNLQNIYGKSYVWDSDMCKAGQLCCDCSGLISSYTGITKSSSMYKATAVKTASMEMVKADWKKYVGWAFWLNGHIGVVSDTEGYYYAMDGSARNMVHYPISKQNWVMALKLCDIDYMEDKEMVENKNINMFGKIRNINVIEKDGCNFIKLQDLNKSRELAVNYDSKNKTPTLNLSFEKLKTTINNKEKILNKAVNVNNETFVNLRELIDACGGSVNYNPETKEIKIDV